MLGGSCRTRLNRDLAKHFKTPNAAEEYYLSLCSPSLNEDNHNSLPTSCSSTVSVNIETVDSLVPLLNNPEQHLLSLSESFSAYCSEVNISVPSDFITLAVKGMLNLKSANRSNTLYLLAKGLGNQRSDGESLFPVKSIVTWTD